MNKFFVLLIVFFVLIVYVFTQTNGNFFHNKKYPYIFSSSVLEKLSNLYENTPKDREFVAFLYSNDENVFYDVGIEGYQTTTGKILGLNRQVEISEHVIHSHPNGSCHPSEKDLTTKKILGKDSYWIICGVNRIEGY